MYPIRLKYISRHDEWINVSSPRLRPLSNIATSASTATLDGETTKAKVSAVKEEVKEEEKPKLKFVVGERCLARWRDNRRFMATINKELGNGQLGSSLSTSQIAIN